MMITFTITGSDAMVQIGQLACSYEGLSAEEIQSTSRCMSKSTGGQWKMALVFGGVEVFLSQVKNLEEAWWVSLIGSLGSVTYVFIVIVIALANSGNAQGDVAGITTATVCYQTTGTGIEAVQISTADKVFGVLNALGSIAFAFNFSLILLEIQDTLKQPPSAIRQMKKTCNIAISLSFFCYFMVAVTGYAAEGNCVQPIIIDSFSGPRWALIISYITVLAHMIMAYQVFGQAIFDTLESQVKAYLIRRQTKAEQESAQLQQPTGEEEEVPSNEKDDKVSTLGGEQKRMKHKVRKSVGGIQTPFDRSATDPEAIQEVDISGWGSLGLDHVRLNPVNNRLSAAYSSHITDQRFSSKLSVAHSAPMQNKPRPSGLRSMYSVDTGFANEEVPLNNEGYVLPVLYRIVLRSAFVLFITVLACVVPFFEALAGLSGSITFFPLAIFFPFACYRALYPVGRKFDVLLKVIWVGTLTVGVVATVGSFSTIIVSWDQYKIFGG